MQVFANDQKPDFLRPKPIRHVFHHSSPSLRTKFPLLSNHGFECFSRTKASEIPKLNVKGSGLTPEKPLGSRSAADDEANNTDVIHHISNGFGNGFLRKTAGKQTKNARNSLLPQLCSELKERQKCENISDVYLSSSPTLPAFSSSVTFKKMNTTKQSKGLKEVRDLYHPRGIMVHTGRHQWLNKKSELLSGSSDRNNCSSLKTHLNLLQHKQITIPPIRANTLHVVLGGKKIEMEERFSLMREIQRLKCVVLPDHARHLFHGKGFKLPINHGSLKPRGLSVPDDDKEDIEPVLRHLKCRQSTVINGQNNQDHLSFIKKSSTFTGLTATSSVRLSKQKIVVKRLKTKLNLLPSTPHQQQHQQKPVQTPKTHPVKTNNGATPNPTENNQSSDELSKSRDELTEEAENFTKLQVKKESREEWISKTPAAVEDNAEDSKNINTNEKEGNYQHLIAENLEPFKLTPLETVPPSEHDTLKETFDKLDTDKDGHLLYNQLQPLLPARFSVNQERFIKEVYNITSQSTFFGISEFWGMTQLTKTIESLSGPALEAYNYLNFDTLNDSISELLTDFQHSDPSAKGDITLDHFRDLLSKHTKQNFLTDKSLWSKILSNILLTDTGSIRKANFLAHIPYFLSIK